MPWAVFQKPSPTGSGWPFSVNFTSAESGSIFGIVRDQRLQVLVDHALEARAIAVERDRAGGAAHARDERSGHEGSRTDDGDGPRSWAQTDSAR